ncbi:MAG: helix-turn-helix transcriptional regulator, partial [Caulobacteraceae bacterium]|nr:helix-turn-helix transcriptional regulator [Caulobacter sp.]
MSLPAAELVEVLRAAGEATRLRILQLLAREELAVAELVRILGQSQPRVSHHLRVLARAGLVERFPDGAWVFYRLAADGPTAALAAEVLRRLDAADYAASLRVLADAGFDGPLALVFEGPGDDAWAGMADER